MTQATVNFDQTSSSTKLKALLRAALLDYQHPNTGASARDVIKENLFDRVAPDGQRYPFGVYRLYNVQRTGEYNGVRCTGILEVTLRGRPVSQFDNISAVADLFDQAMTAMRRISHGLVFCRGNSQRDDLPPSALPSDSATCGIRLLYSVTFWPDYLTRPAR